MEEILEIPSVDYFGDFETLILYLESLGNPKYKIMDDLDIFNNHNITTLGNLTYVDGYCDISHTNIESLPDNLTTNSFLDISYTNIDSLPDNLHVEGILNLYNTPLSKKYSKEKIRKMIEDKGGSVKSDIYI